MTLASGPLTTVFQDRSGAALRGGGGVGGDGAGGVGGGRGGRRRRHCWHPSEEAPDDQELTQPFPAYCCWCEKREMVTPMVEVPLEGHGRYYVGPGSEWRFNRLPSDPCPGRRAA